MCLFDDDWKLAQHEQNDGQGGGSSIDLSIDEGDDDEDVEDMPELEAGDDDAGNSMEEVD